MIKWGIALIPKRTERTKANQGAKAQTVPKSNRQMGPRGGSDLRQDKERGGGRGKQSSVAKGGLEMGYPLKTGHIPICHSELPLESGLYA